MPSSPRAFRHLTVLATLAGLFAHTAFAADTAAKDGLPATTRSRIDAAANEVLQATGVPGTSIAIVRDGRTVYAKAYGFARLEPSRPADPAMRYEIGSISKQFLVAAVLLLQQEGKLSLDDTVAKYFPDLTRAGDITIRQLLTHTSGYQDCCPQDYAIPDWLQPITAEAYIESWGRKPLDYEPGTRYQYSNTGYAIAGRIVEKASGQPLFEFLQQRIFKPLQMTSVYNADALPAGPDDPTGYRRLALGPPRVSPNTGAGWSFGSGGLAMTAADLARWDISFMNRSLLSEPSYRAIETDTLLANGVATGYGLGVDVKFENQRHTVEHGGERTALRKDIENPVRAGPNPGRREDRPGTRDLHGTAAGQDRPQPVHVQRQLLFLGRGAGRFQVEPRPIGCAGVVRADTVAAAWRHDGPPVRGEVRQADAARLDVRDARREDRAVPGGGEGLGGGVSLPG